MSDRPVIRDAAAGDLDRCAATLAASHRDHPWDRWALTGSTDLDAAPNDDVEARLRRLTDVWFRLSVLPAGHARVAADADAVAVWVPHDVEPLGDDITEALEAVAAEVLGDRATIVAEVEARVREHRPGHPHVVLATLGTDPPHQGGGLASALIDDHLDRLDDAELAVAVETSSERNVTFYERFGFEVTAELDDLPDDCPTTWMLVREPA